MSLENLRRKPVPAEIGEDAIGTRIPFTEKSCRNPSFASASLHIIGSNRDLNHPDFCVRRGIARGLQSGVLHRCPTRRG
jgi:hypothetical protein